MLPAISEGFPAKQRQLIQALLPNAINPPERLRKYHQKVLYQTSQEVPPRFQFQWPLEIYVNSGGL